MTSHCPHGVPTDSVTKWDVFKGINACDQCYDEDWQRVKWATIAGCVGLVALIMIIPVLILTGTFW